MAAGLDARGVEGRLDPQDSKFPPCLAEQSLPLRRAEKRDPHLSPRKGKSAKSFDRNVSEIIVSSERVCQERVTG